MSLHPLLIRQLKKMGLSENEAPANLSQWKMVLDKISNNYEDNDQDRYLIERSLEISSREMHDLNKRLEDSPHIAKMGYWFYDATQKRAIWSKESYYLFDYDPLESPPSYEKFMERVHPDDRSKIDQAVEEAISHGKKYEIEIRYFFPNQQKKIRWFRCIGFPEIPEELGRPIEKISGVALDITVRKEAEAEIIQLNEKLLDTARRAGMSEIATTILHNIGNVLNSVNVSAELMEENLKNLEFERIEKVASMMEDNLGNIQQYLTKNTQGKLILDYLKIFAKNHKEMQIEIAQELKVLLTHIHHIRDIIMTQQSYTGVGGVTEKITLQDALDAALKISSVSLDNSISIEKNYGECVILLIDKSKLQQILVNLIQNARDSVLASNKKIKKIIITIKKMGKNEVVVSVSDNGVGISSENITRIFGFGFTSKKQGHGVGLHSCALAAKEMRGSLYAESEGLDKGATFILTLPLQNGSERRDL